MSVKCQLLLIECYTEMMKGIWFHFCFLWHRFFPFFLFYIFSGLCSRGFLIILPVCQLETLKCIKIEIVVDNLYFYKMGGWGEEGCLTWCNNRETFFLPYPAGNVASFPLLPSWWLLFFQTKTGQFHFLEQESLVHYLTKAN